MEKLQMKRHGKKGLLITFCGLDGCGKSTMIRMLYYYLKQQAGFPEFLYQAKQ